MLDYVKMMYYIQNEFTVSSSRLCC